MPVAAGAVAGPWQRGNCVNPVSATRSTDVKHARKDTWEQCGGTDPWSSGFNSYKSERDTRDECLAWCSEQPGATGCELLLYTGTSNIYNGCYVFTDPAVAPRVTAYSSNTEWCSVFSAAAPLPAPPTSAAPCTAGTAAPQQALFTSIEQMKREGWVGAFCRARWLVGMVRQRLSQGRACVRCVAPWPTRWMGGGGCC